jgi:hypothetical protein
VSIRKAVQDMSKWKDPDWREFFKAALAAPLPLPPCYVSTEVQFVTDRAEAIADEATRRMREAEPNIKEFRVGAPAIEDIERRAEAVRDVLRVRGIKSEVIRYHGRIGVSFGDGTGDGMFVDGHHDNPDPETLADEALKIRDVLATQRCWSIRGTFNRR